MKKILQIFSLLQAVILFSFTLFYGNLQIEASENYLSKSTSQSWDYSFSASSFYLPTASNQEIDSSLSGISTQTRTNQCFNLDFSNKIKELILNNIYSDYLYYSIHLIPLSLNTPDIIYPFHYFW